MKRFLLLPPVLLLFPCLSLAADWPGWRGPHRDGLSAEKGLLKTWPRSGPPLLWTFEETGIGYGGPAVVGDRLYIMGGDESKEYLYALDVNTGKKVWTAEVGPFFNNAWGGGPRGTPTVDGDRVYALGGEGSLICARRADGTVVWRVTMADFGGTAPTWGYAESPLVDGDKLLCTPGGRKGAVVALNKQTGKLLWQSSAFTEAAQYSSIVPADNGGKHQYVQLTMRKLVGLDAADGAVLWQVNWPGRTAVIPTPLVHRDHVYATAGYNAGCMLVRLGKDNTAEVVYQNKVMTNQHGGVILLGGHVYGYSDRGSWVCQSFADGKQVWASRQLGKGSLAYADGHFYCYAERDGTCALIEATTAGWSEKGRFKIPKESKTGRGYNNRSNFWTHPVIANGRLYLRDQEYLFCYDVKEAP